MVEFRANSAIEGDQTRLEGKVEVIQVDKDYDGPVEDRHRQTKDGKPHCHHLKKVNPRHTISDVFLKEKD